MDLLRISAAMMDADYRTEHEVVQRYIHHQMPANELAAFEVVLIAHPELSDEIEAQRVLNYRRRELPAMTQSRAGLLVAGVAHYWRGGMPLALALVIALLVGLVID